MATCVVNLMRANDDDVLLCLSLGVCVCVLLNYFPTLFRCDIFDQYIIHMCAIIRLSLFSNHKSASNWVKYGEHVVFIGVLCSGVH